MDLELLDEFFEQQPKYNPLLAEGFATSQMKLAPEYISNEFKQAMDNSFPPELRYIGWAMCSPERTFQILSNIKHRNNSYYEISHSDVYLVEYKFTLHGRPMRNSVCVFLPMLNRGGWMTLKGSHFHNLPVLGDIAISVGSDYLFVQSKMKLKFHRIFHHVMVNGVREVLNVVWSQINNSKPKRMKSCLMHYLLVRFGLTETFKRYTGADVFHGAHSKFNRSDYPEDEWVICKSAKPSFIVRGKRRILQLRSNMTIAVHVSDWNEAMKGMVASFFYIADQYPEQISSKNDLDDTYIWKILLGNILLNEDEGVGKIISYIDTHLDSLDTYMTGSLRRLLVKEGVVVDDIYDLFVDIIATFSKRIATSSDNLSTMYNKCYMVLRYVLLGLIKGINHITFQFPKFAGKTLLETDVEKIFRDNIKMNTVLYLASSEHQEISSVSSSTDSLIYKFSMPSILQANTSKPKNKKVEVAFGPESVAHASIAEIGNPNVNPSKDPTGRQPINLFANVDSMGIIHRHEDFVELMDDVQSNIRR